MARAEKEIIELWIDYIQLQKFMLTINHIKYVKGKTEFLSLLNDFGVVRLATVLRELISHYYPTKTERDTAMFNLDGRNIAVQEAYRICCKIVHINIFNNEMPENYILKIAVIGAELFERCDKNDARIKKCIALPHSVNHEIAKLYGL